MKTTYQNTSAFKREKERTTKDEAQQNLEVKSIRMYLEEHPIKTNHQRYMICKGTPMYHEGRNQ